MSKIGGGGGDGGAAAAAAQRRKEEEARQARIRAGLAAIDDAFSGFDESFYDTRSQAYRDYYLPQLTRQAEDANETLIADLARAGLLRSSAGNEAIADLSRQVAEQEGFIRNTAETEADNLRSQIAAERNALVNALQINADPDIATSSALASSQAIRDTTPSLSPLTAVLAPALVGGGNFLRGRQQAETSRIANALTATNPRATGRTITVT